MAIKRAVTSTQDYDINQQTSDWNPHEPAGGDPNLLPPPVIPPPPAPVIPPPTQPPTPVVDPNKPPVQPTTTARTTAYDPAAGWDVGKLNDPNADDVKYDFGRAAQDYTGGYGRGNLQGLIDYYNTTYGGHAKAAGEDLIDFGEAYGPVDVINGQTEGLQWLVPSSADLAANKAGTGGGGGAAAGTLSGINDAIAAMAKQLTGGAGLSADQKVQAYNQPGGPGVFDPSAVQQVGQDPFSQEITDAYGNLIKYQQDQLNQPTDPVLTGEDPLSQQLSQAYADYIRDEQAQLRNPTNLVPYFEGARMPYEIARRTQLNNARGELANRGLLSEPGHLQGPEVGAVQRVEEGLAPSYTGAIADRLTALDQLELQKRTGLLNALAGGTAQQKAMADRLGILGQLKSTKEQNLLATLTGGTQRQKALADIAIANLDQNRLWQEFIAKNGLDRDRLTHDIENGNIDQYLQLLQLWLQSANIAAGGFI